ncbi:MAG: hypothetical protein LBR97_06685 [Dysgonamonadaceae bacterium]|jgi:hypothetical protein|nr:hypothetical protein [Dysgonamonadaceae bacterium]
MYNFFFNTINHLAKDSFSGVSVQAGHFFYNKDVRETGGKQKSERLRPIGRTKQIGFFIFFV